MLQPLWFRFIRLRVNGVESELARQSVARGIVKSISLGSVGRFLKKRLISSRTATVTG